MAVCIVPLLADYVLDGSKGRGSAVTVIMVNKKNNIKYFLLNI